MNDKLTLHSYAIRMKEMNATLGVYMQCMLPTQKKSHTGICRVKITLPSSLLRGEPNKRFTLCLRLVVLDLREKKKPVLQEGGGMYSFFHEMHDICIVLLWAVPRIYVHIYIGFLLDKIHQVYLNEFPVIGSFWDFDLIIS